MNKNKNLMKHLFFVLILFIISIKTNLGQTQHKPIKVGLVLSGGGAKGFAHVGTLKVLEELGYEFDYIAGTTIASIMGALTAIGYKAQDLENIITEQNWEDLLFDKSDRRKISMIEKKELERYIVTVPFKKFKIKIPTGLIKGQNIINLLTKLTIPSNGETDFSKFKIPFLCIATDMETGEPLVLEKGILAQAIRASMSIPGAFEAVQINGKILVDGGLVNNFPVHNLKEKGMDIIIGVNVGAPAYKKEELSSIMKIIEQTMFFGNESAMKEEKQMCDVYIEPNLSGYGTNSFSKEAADTLIKRGEIAAMKQYKRLKTLLDSINQINANYKIQKKTREYVKIPDSILIKGVGIEGLKKVSLNMITGNIKVKYKNLKLSIKDIEENIENISGTQFFDLVTYKLAPMEEGYKITLIVEEKNVDYLRFGVNFNSDFKASLLLNLSYRNLLLKGSKLSADFNFGENLQYNVSYYKKISKNRGLNAVANIYGIFTNAFLYDENSIDKINYKSLNMNIGLESNYSNNHFFGMGTELQYINTNIAIGNLKMENCFPNYSLINFYAKFQKDSYNKVNFPNTGTYSGIEYKLITLSNSKIIDYFRKTKLVHNFKLSYSNAIPINQKLTLLSTLYGSFVTDSLYPYFSSVGGSGNYGSPFVAFYGLNYSNYWVPSLALLRLDLQYEIRKDFYLTTLCNISSDLYNVFDEKHEFNYSNIAHYFRIKKPVVGYGLQLGYLSAIGPIKLSWTRSIYSPNNILYINLGFYF